MIESFRKDRLLKERVDYAMKISTVNPECNRAPQPRLPLPV